VWSVGDLLLMIILMMMMMIMMIDDEELMTHEVFMGCALKIAINKP
jgi:hypothetical protein